MAKIISIDFDSRNIDEPIMSVEKFNIQFKFIPYWGRQIIRTKHDSLHIALTTLSKAQHTPVALRIQMDRNKINTHK